MLCSQLSTKTSNNIGKIRRNFFEGESEDAKGLAMISWATNQNPYAQVSQRNLIIKDNSSNSVFLSVTFVKMVQWRRIMAT